MKRPLTLRIAVIVNALVLVSVFVGCPAKREVPHIYREGPPTDFPPPFIPREGNAPGLPPANPNAVPDVKVNSRPN